MNATTGTETITVDEALELLADERRRRLLRHLAESDGTATVDQLVTVLDADAPSPEALGRTRDRLAADLHHVHLPKLHAAGLVEYRHREGTVRYRSNDRIEALLRACSDY